MTDYQTINAKMKMLKFVLLKEFNKEILLRYAICDRLWAHQCQNEVAEIRPLEGIKKTNKMRYVTYDRLSNNQCQNEVAEIRPPGGIQ